MSSPNLYRTTIEELCLKVTSGGTPSRKNSDFYTGEIPWIKTGELKGWYINNSSEKITEEAIGSSSAKIYPINTVLMAMYGDGGTMGSTAITGMEAASNQACCAMVPDTKKCNPLYLLFLLQFHRERIVSLALGGAQRNLNQRTIKSYEVDVHGLEDQNKTVASLINYNNLIENNNRRITILEDMAQSLYREWFVKFRFPGHEGCQFKDSSLGQIPEGWEVRSAADVIDINPRTTLPKEGIKPFVPMTSLSESSMIINDIEARAGNSGTKFKNRDTLFARITPCLQNGKIGYVQCLSEENPIGFGSTEFIVLRESVLSSEYIYCLARSNNFRSHAINSMAGADGRQRVKSDCFASYYFAVPPQNLLDEFSSIAKAFFAEIYILNSKNKNLRRQRDMLLSKLISGRINI